MKKYFPILLSKSGEFSALKNLTQNVKDEITPIIQVLEDASSALQNFALQDWSFTNNEIFFDFSLCEKKVWSSTEVLINTLSAHGVNITILVQANSSRHYISFVQGLLSNNIIRGICIRISNSSGFNNVKADIQNILSQLRVGSLHKSILLDVGHINSSNYNVISSMIISIINQISNNTAFKDIIVASGSFPENLGTLLPPGQLHKLQRHEWNFWQSVVLQNNTGKELRYGDYGTKNAVFADVKYSGTCSIKYSNEKEYLIYRGEVAKNHPHGNGQYIVFADMHIKSIYYLGSNFSWGDGRISFYASQNVSNPGYQPGNATTWVTISQNHHLTLLHSLL